MRRAVFLDRDGTLIEEKNYLAKVEQVRVLPGVGQALADLRRAGFVCVVTTNQSGLGRGYFTEVDLAVVHEEMRRQLRGEGVEIDAIYHCAVAPRVNDKTTVEHPERKPGPGMLLRAAGEMDLDLAASWMVGDSISDILAGRLAGCRGGILVRTGHDVLSSLALLRDREIVVDDLLTASRWILQGGAGCI